MQPTEDFEQSIQAIDQALGEIERTLMDLYLAYGIKTFLVLRTGLKNTFNITQNPVFLKFWDFV